MIGELQGDFGDLDNKYLKQNIPKYLKMSVGNIRKLQENTAALCRMAALPSDVRIPGVNGGSRV